MNTTKELIITLLLEQIAGAWEIIDKPLDLAYQIYAEQCGITKEEVIEKVAEIQKTVEFDYHTHYVDMASKEYGIFADAYRYNLRENF